jgi:hypothetical protein
VLEYITPPDDMRTHLAQVRFLSDEGPSQWLEPSRGFALYEGNEKVAEGIVISNMTEVRPDSK